jgi:hypothetical protein
MANVAAGSIAVILPSTTNGRIQFEAVVDAAWGAQGSSQLQAQLRLQDGRLGSGLPRVPGHQPAARRAASIYPGTCPRTGVFSPSPLAGEGLGRGGKTEALALAPSPPAPPPPGGRGGIHARQPGIRPAVPGHQPAAPRAASISPARGEGGSLSGSPPPWRGRGWGRGGSLAGVSVWPLLPNPYPGTSPRPRALSPLYLQNRSL